MQLRELYCQKVEVQDDMLQKVLEVTHGGVRRICVNLERIQQHAMSKGLKSIGLAEWGRRELYTGEAPARRI